MIKIEGLFKSYEGKFVLSNVSCQFQEEGIYCLMGASGSGKTTFLHVLMGLVTPDKGHISGLEHKKFSAVFQENRLLDNYNAVENLRLVVDNSTKNEKIVEHLLEILPADALQKPVRELSGGMKRRVAVARAMITEAEVIFMDEPFTGLDEITRDSVIAYVRKESKGRLVLIATHQPEDIEKLGASVLEFA